MKFVLRFILALPFPIVTFFYLDSYFANEKCSLGIIDIGIALFYLILFILVIILALMASYSKVESAKIKVDFFILGITIATFLVLFIGRVFGDNFKSKEWIVAESAMPSGYSESQTLVLRKNNIFIITLHNIENSCTYSGKYDIVNDTIIFDANTVAKTESALTTTYLLYNDTLKPIIDTTTNKNKYNSFFVKRDK